MVFCAYEAGQAAFWAARVRYLSHSDMIQNGYVSPDRYKHQVSLWRQRFIDIP
jgi:hypothetical protein